MKRVALLKRISKFSPTAKQVRFAVGGVLLLIALILMQRATFRQERLTVKPLSFMVGRSARQQCMSDARWKNREGWWGGYWWGSDSFTWKGREWGLGKSAYPWYWEYDKLALELNLVELAKAGRWADVEHNLLEKISSLRQEIERTDNKAKKRKFERTIDRAECYLYDAKQYRRTPVRF